MKIIILENIRSAYNVGAIFRTADGAGVDKIYLIGYTPTPIDRFGRPQPEISKTSLGASQTMQWEHAVETKPVIEQLQLDGVVVVAIEQGPRAVALTTFTVPNRVAYVMGNEVEGVLPSTLSQVDHIVDIPMLGHKESLNVSVAAGIVMYHGIATG